MPGKLTDQIAIVTGGNSGIGEATVHAFAREGAKVAIFARRENEGRAVEAAVRDSGGEAKFIPCDVSDRQQVDAAVQSVVDAHGGVDVLVNNAGGGGPGNFPDEEDDVWNRVLAVNLSGTFYMSRAVWPHMIDGGGGRIVNVSSVAAQRGFSKKMFDLIGFGPSASYYAAKAGVDAFTRYAASAGGQHNIRVNGIRPGQIITPATNTGDGNHRLGAIFDFVQILETKGYPQDIAETALFLVSDDAKFITGEIVNVDGGIPAKL